MLPLGGVLPNELLLRLLVMLPLGELLPYPNPAGSVRKPRGVPLLVMLPDDGDPLAVMLPVRDDCTPAVGSKQLVCRRRISAVLHFPLSARCDGLRIMLLHL